jgi:hypothetical protein
MKSTSAEMIPIDGERFAVSGDESVVPTRQRAERAYRRRR